MSFDTMVNLGKDISTILFFSFFMYVFYDAYKKGNKEELEAIRFSIFDDEEIRRMSNVNTRGT